MTSLEEDTKEYLGVGEPSMMLQELSAHDYYGESSQIPFISKGEVVRKVSELLNECWDGVFPVDIEKICDYLGIAVVPVARLRADSRIDAFISANFKTIYVDADKYERESYRYRFSVAHELGHYILHREYYPSRIWNYQDWCGLSSGKFNRVTEFQANYFAGSLLAPENELIGVLNSRFKGSFARNYFSTSHEELEKALTSAQKFFKVSEQVITRRMQDTVYGLNEHYGTARAAT